MYSYRRKPDCFVGVWTTGTISNSRALPYLQARLLNFLSTRPNSQQINSDVFSCSFAFGELPSVGSFACPNTCYFLFLDKKKVSKEKSRLQIILGLLFFSLPVQYNSPELRSGSNSIAYLRPTQQASKHSLFPKII